MKITDCTKIWADLNLRYGKNGDPAICFFNAVQILIGWPPFKNCFGYNATRQGIWIRAENGIVRPFTYATASELIFRIERDLNVFGFSQKMVCAAVEYLINTKSIQPQQSSNEKDVI